MTKNDFRSLYSAVEIGAQVTFLTVASAMLREGTVESKRKGRGRGGAPSMVVRAGDDLVVLSSTKAHEIQYVGTSELTFGSLVNVVTNYNLRANPEQASAVKRVFEKVLADVKSNGSMSQSIVINAPSNIGLHGRWCVNKARILRGRNGQVALELLKANDSGLANKLSPATEIWSRRVSSVMLGCRAMLSTGEVVDYGDVSGLPQQ